MDEEIKRLKAKTEYLDNLIHDVMRNKKDKMLPSTKLMLAIIIGTITTGFALILGLAIGKWC